MPSTRNVRQRSTTPICNHKGLEQSVQLTPGWSAVTSDTFKLPSVFSPLKTRARTRRQTMFIKSTTIPKPTVVHKKENLSSTKMTRVGKTSKNSSTSELKVLPKKPSRTRSSSRSRSMTRKYSEPGSKIPVKSRESTPSRRTPSRSTPGRTTRSRSRSRTRAVTPLASQKNSHSKKRVVRQLTPTRQGKKVLKRRASPARTDALESSIKVAKVLETSEANDVVTPKASTPSSVSRKIRSESRPVGQVRYSKRLADKEVIYTSMDIPKLSDEAAKREVTVDNGKASWGAWCAIL